VYLGPLNEGRYPCIVRYRGNSSAGLPFSVVRCLTEGALPIMESDLPGDSNGYFCCEMRE
jgi:hypothetical protein